MGKELLNKKQFSEIFETRINPFFVQKKDLFIKIINEKITPKTRNFLENEELCKNIFEQFYDILPKSVKLLIKKEIFIDYCVKNKKKVIDLIDSKLCPSPSTASTNDEKMEP